MANLSNFPESPVAPARETAHVACHIHASKHVRSDTSAGTPTPISDPKILD